jgi:hypothetical protein
MSQLELFHQSEASTPQKILREEERFGFWHASFGLPFRNSYSLQLSGHRLIAYERGFRSILLADL